MKVIVWNSQGAKWANLWSHFEPAMLSSGQEDVIGLALETGWADWVRTGNVIDGRCYNLDETRRSFDPARANASNFCLGVQRYRQQRLPIGAFWFPWVPRFNAPTNSRCSLGGIVFRGFSTFCEVDRLDIPGFYRPIIRLRFSRANGNLRFTILCGHLVSGAQALAQSHVDYLVSVMQELITQGTSAFICGDLNIDLLQVLPPIGQGLNLPRNFKLCRAGVATQQSGSELDWGILYNPNCNVTVNVSIIETFKTGTNQSDHSIMGYDITLP